MTAEAMGEISANDVLRRKARAGLEERKARLMSAARAMRLSLSRAAETLFELAVSVSDVFEEQLSQEALMRSVDAEMLLVLLDGPQGALGVMGIDLPLVNSIVEKQTIGRVSEGVGASCAATATDAALIAPYITRVLEGMSEELSIKDRALTEGFAFGARIESKRHLGLLLEVPDYRVLRAQIELESGVKRGELVLCLPIGTPESVNATQIKAASKTADTQDVRRLRDGALMEARAVVRAVIHRRQMTLGELSNLKVGEQLHFGAGALARVELDMGVGATSLGPCKLGKQDGMRALKLQFGARAQSKTSFEPMGEADIWLAEDALQEAYSGLPAKPPMQPITVDDLPDLSDLPGFEAEGVTTDSFEQLSGLEEDVSQVC